MISYKPLWQTMEKRNISTYALINEHGINPRTVNHLKHDKSVTVYTLEKLCRILNCRIENIIEILPDTDET